MPDEALLRVASHDALDDLGEHARFAERRGAVPERARTVDRSCTASRCAAARFDDIDHRCDREGGHDLEDEVKKLLPFVALLGACKKDEPKQEPAPSPAEL